MSALQVLVRVKRRVNISKVTIVTLSRRRIAKAKQFFAFTRRTNSDCFTDVARTGRFAKGTAASKSETARNSRQLRSQLCFAECQLTSDTKSWRCVAIAQTSQLGTTCCPKNSKSARVLHNSPVRGGHGHWSPHRPHFMRFLQNCMQSSAEALSVCKKAHRTFVAVFAFRGVVAK
jgi:hypothetical protein